MFVNCKYHSFFINLYYVCENMSNINCVHYFCYNTICVNYNVCGCLCVQYKYNINLYN